MSTSNKAPVLATDQKCNYCGGAGKWTKDILAGQPAESVNCPHCHGSGRAGQSNMGELMAAGAQTQDE